MHLIRISKSLDQKKWGREGSSLYVRSCLWPFGSFLQPGEKINERQRTSKIQLLFLGVKQRLN